MGSANSRTEKRQHRQEVFLIGKLNGKYEVEQKIFNLALNCLQNCDRLLDNKNDLILASGQATADSSHETNHNQEEVLEANLNIRTIINEDLVLSSEINSHSVDDRTCNQNCALESKQSYLFNAILNGKRLFATETYVSWRARHDLERASNFYRDKRKIYLLEIEDLPNFMKTFKFTIATEILTLYDIIFRFMSAFFYGFEIIWLKTLYIKEQVWTITSRHHEKTGKFQYLVKDFYKPLQKYKPKDGYCIMGYSWADLYPCEKLNFVLGEASSEHKAGLVSFGRFEPKNYDPDTSKDITAVDTHFLWKLLKCSSHEMCHLFGLSHCDFFDCSMNGSNSIEQAMSQPLFLCPVCLRKLQHACKFDIMERYHALLKVIKDINLVFPSDNWQKSIDWLHRCMQYLNTVEQTHI